ncbi:PP2C family protein-serine/threonine phosphatase [Nocardia pseudobrasiliensis]|uniref:Serine phosphatase n=1 Tax=Nocardia pseudobrasiliensis TaxID=45979 RepID=A0A370HZN1_9NOCA|nr:SpoIIE family protein phosphatase [Nocardia pseudobrasiliensis]RDI63952.1 serine phosphatase [Nocardia pseudobrasiliensis]
MDEALFARPLERRSRWSEVPHPVVVVDRSGAVVDLSSSARSLLPEIVAGRRLHDTGPSWLSLAHDDRGAADAVAGRSNDRVFHAHATELEDESVAWWLIEDEARALRAAHDALAEERERTAFLTETSDVLLASLNVERCMETTVRMAASRLADAAVVVAPAVGRSLPITSCSEGIVRHRQIEADPESVVGLGEALRGFPPVPSRWIDPAALPDWLLPEDFSGPVGSVVITPLPGHGVPAGALILLRRTDHQVFSERDEVFAHLFAARAGIALSAARLYAEQASITGVLTRDLLPPRLHRIEGLELAGGYRASENHQVVGGDFYDVHPAAVPDGETLVVLGDVCGKGLEAAVLTGKIRNTVAALVSMADDHERLLNLLNSALLSSGNTRFATLVLASVTTRDDGLELRLTSAGHPPPLIARADGRVETAETRGQLVGALPRITATTYRTTLAPGETCLLYTDGVTEARGGPLGRDMFGEHRLSAAVAECAGLPAEAVVERIQMLTAQWVGHRQHDDIAVVAITAPHRPRPGAVRVSGTGG